jgi:2-methylcitrate dehydratase PrpD
LGTTLRPGMDPHGSWPIVAAAATASLLTGTDLRKTINLVTSFNLATSSKAACEGATIRNIYAGFGSAMGVLAADLCQDGFSAERDGISTVFGTIAGVFFDVEKAVEKIGDRWEIGRSYYRPYASSRHVQPALDGLIAIQKDHPFTPGDVERIEVSTYAMAAALNSTTPKNPLAALYSIPYVLASYLAIGETAILGRGGEAPGDLNIQQLAAKVIIKEDWELSRRTPLERPARVTLYLHDGRIFERLVELPRGEWDAAPLSDGELSEKFIRLASGLLGVERSKALLDSLWHIEEINDLKEVMATGRIDTSSNAPYSP